MQIERTRWNTAPRRRNSSLLPAPASCREDRVRKKNKESTLPYFERPPSREFLIRKKFSSFFLLYIYSLYLPFYPYIFSFFVFYYTKDLPLPLSLNLLFLAWVLREGWSGRRGKVCSCLCVVRNGKCCFHLLRCFVLTLHTRTAPTLFLYNAKAQLLLLLPEENKTKQ